MPRSPIEPNQYATRQGSGAPRPVSSIGLDQAHMRKQEVKMLFQIYPVVETWWTRGNIGMLIGGILGFALIIFLIWKFLISKS